MKAEGLASDSENEVAIIINEKLYGQLHGNYMFNKKNNNYETLYHHITGSGRNPDCLQF